MSHTIRKINLGNTAFAEIVIVDYVQGGEVFTLAELGLTGALQSAVFLKAFNAQQIVPELSGGKVLLFASELPALHPELPSTVGLNFLFVAVVHGT